jgi:SAM-dependent methyltransferase
MQEDLVDQFTYPQRIVRFRNDDRTYRVNRRQSLFMATTAVVETLAYAGVRRVSVGQLRAWEPCCGGGPAAVVLKAAGVGFVRATDISEDAIRACRRNAELNQLHINSVEIDDLLKPLPLTPDKRFDLIVCNPPCRPTELIPDSVRGSNLNRAIDGGKGGLDFYVPLIHQAREQLKPGGLLLFALTSTVDVNHVRRALNDHFAGCWRVAYTTPVAHRFVVRRSPEGETAMRLGREGKIFVWDGEDDQWVWRLSWVIVAAKTEQPLVSTLWLERLTVIHRHFVSLPERIVRSRT